MLGIPTYIHTYKLGSRRVTDKAKREAYFIMII